MTANAAFTAKDEDGVSTGYQVGASGKAAVQVDANSVWDGAQIEIEVCHENTSAKYSFVGTNGVIHANDPEPRLLPLPEGYWVRLKQTGSGENTSITATITTT